MITVGSLFSGIGGLELGLERTNGFKTIWQSEIDPYASAILAKHWPLIPNLGDIRNIEWNTAIKPDLICGGFPCQDISLAGKGAGIKEGTRSGLWKEYHKALCFLRPRLVLVENVSAFSFRGLLEVLGDLAQIGYDAEWFTIRASDVGAPHRRERLFIIANHNEFWDGWRGAFPTNGKENIELTNSYGNGLQGFKQQSKPRKVYIKTLLAQKLKEIRNESWFEKHFSEPQILGMDDGFSNYVHRIKCLGNAVVPQVAQAIGEAILERENL